MAVFPYDRPFQFSAEQAEYIKSVLTDLVYNAIGKAVEERLPELLDRALDRQKKNVADELVRILLSKAL